MPTDLSAIALFAHVVEQGSFAAAARLLNMPKATVSRRIAELEAALGVRLMNRTTRSLSLTDVGRLYLVHAQRIVAEIALADAVARDSVAEPSGILRMTASSVLAQTFLTPILIEYMRTYPLVRLSLHVTNRLVDLVEEGFDLAIRAGALQDSRLVTRKLGLGVAKLYASPAYLRGQPDIVGPSDLERHRLIDQRNQNMPVGSWELIAPQRRATRIAVAPYAGVSDAGVAAAFALAGCGIAPLPTFIAAPHVLERTLAAVLPDWVVNTVEISAVFPTRVGLNPAVRSLLDLLARRFREQVPQGVD